MIKKRIISILPSLVLFGFLFSCNVTNVSKSETGSSISSQSASALKNDQNYDTTAKDSSKSIEINQNDQVSGKLMDSLQKGNSIFIHLADDVSIELTKSDYIPQIISKIFPNVIIADSYAYGHQLDYYAYTSAELFDMNKDFNTLVAKMPNFESIPKNDIFQAYAQIVIGFKNSIEFKDIIQKDTIIDQFNNGKLWNYNYKIRATVAGREETILVKYSNNELYTMNFVVINKLFSPSIKEPITIKAN
jgi:hypothetical protein